MRYILLLMILFSSVAYGSDFQWSFTDEYEGDRMSNTTRIAALDTSNYIVAETVLASKSVRLIKRTSDYGKSWDTLYTSVIDDSYPSNQHFSFSDIDYLDKNNIIALFGYYNILRSTDGGSTWKEKRLYDEFPFSKIYHLDSCVFLSGASGSQIAISQDFGDSWELNEINYEVDSLSRYENIMISSIKAHNDTLYMPIYFRDKLPFYNTLGYINHNLFMMSTDYGKNWEQLFFNKDSESSSVFDIDDNFLYTQYTDFTFDTVLVNSPDGNGIDTAEIATPHSHIVRVDKFTGKYETIADSVSLPLSDIISLAKFGNVITLSTSFASYLSIDNGYSWSEEKHVSPKPNYSTFGSIARASASKGLAVGTNCFATLQPTTSVTEQNKALQNIHLYPNPAVPGSKINLEFDATETGEYSFRLSSMDGRNIDLMQNDFFSRGRVSKSIELNSNLTAGTYVLSVYNNDKLLASKRFVIEK